MRKALLIAEKPSLMRDIQASYNRHRNQVPYEITFKAQHGHLVELLSPVELNPLYKSWNPEYLPIIPEEEGGWKYKVKKDSLDTFNDIKNSLQTGGYDVVIHAGDPDQEGELLVNLVLELAGNRLPVLRFWPQNTTDSGLLSALLSMKSDDDPQYKHLYEAALVRQHSDWRFGMNGSRAIADRIMTNEKIAAGRVMTWIQTAVVDREDQIKNFVEKTSYGLDAAFSNGLITHLYQKAGEGGESGNIFFDEKEEAEQLLKSLPQTGTVTGVESKKVTTNPPKLYKLATAQIDAAKMHFTADQTLQIIQKLYEKHFISYPRTDCEVVASSEDFSGMISSVRAAIPEFADAANHADTQVTRIMGIKKYVNDAELAKHGHSALVPTTDSPDLSSLSIEEQQIYKMICRRFLCIFQPPLIQEKTDVMVDVGGNDFHASGKTTIDKGFTEFIGSKTEDTELPKVTKGQKLDVNDFIITERTTTPPKRFTDGTLIQAMEDPRKYLSDKSLKDNLSVDALSIGTPATRAATITKVIKDGYIKRSRAGVFEPTEFGSFMIHHLHGISLCQTDTTGNNELVLKAVREGKMEFGKAEEYMERQVEELIDDIKKVNKVSFGKQNNVVMDCPGCQNGNHIIEGPKNFYCTGFRNGCRYSLMKNFMGAKFTADDVRTLFSGGTVTKKLTKKDKSASWSQELGFTAEKSPWPEFIEPQGVTLSAKCPSCGAALIKKGKRVNCKECDFGVWGTLCGHEFTDEELSYIMKNGKSKGKINGFASKKGTSFNARVELVNEGKDSKFNFKF